MGLILGVNGLFELIKNDLPLIISIFCFFFFLLLPLFFRKIFRFKLVDFISSLFITSILYFVTIYVFNLSRIDYILDAFRVCNNNLVVFSSLFALLIESGKKSVLINSNSKIIILVLELLVVINFIIITKSLFNNIKIMVIKFVSFFNFKLKEQRNYIFNNLFEINNNFNIYISKYNC